MERVFGCKSNVCRQMRRAGVVTLEAANVWLRQSLVPAFTTRFGKSATEEGTAFIAYIGVLLDDVRRG
jgi:hypothetical protein